MISKSRLKEIVLSNEESILTQIKKIVKRERIYLPENLDKVVVFYGVRRSGKTFILFDLFKKMSEPSLYIDFEDERLVDFQIGDFERVKEVALELKPHLIGKEMVFLLDEIQNIRGWEKFCRRVVERENVKICLSGSSSKIMPLEIHTVFLELKRRGYEVFYFEEKVKCDFIVRNQEDKFLPMQVSFELTEENRQREIKGLIDACKWLEINKGVILTYDEEAELNVGRIYIEILPIWKWLLANDRGQVLFGT